ILELSLRYRATLGVKSIALSGGCWQNIWLLTQAHRELAAAGFAVYGNSNLPAGDGGLAYGQAAIGAALQR
ncbi:MAG: hypothetical protein FWG06_02460, partial [Clostridiales bacterium]|nr:hypothetical protein [Clostridiales bacterium]